jgi:arsenate reductase
MSQWKVYEYAKCSTCQKALEFLDRKKIKYQKIAIVDQPPTEAELRKMLAFLGGELKKLFNTSGIQYREMGMSEKLKTLTEGEAIRLLSKNGKLIKRPFLLGDRSGAVGFKEAEWSTLLK